TKPRLLEIGTPPEQHCPKAAVGSAKEKGTLQVQFTYDGNFLRDEYSGRELQNDFQRDRNRTTQSLLAELSYDISARLSASALLTSVIQSREIVDENLGSRTFVQNAGIGDAILLLKYRLYGQQADQTSQVVLGAGPKLPLGRTDFRDNVGILLPMDLQPGTGALDWIFWGHFTQTELIRKSTQLTAILTYRLPGTSTHNALQLPYDFGREFQAQLGISDRFLLGSLILDPGLMTKFRTVGADQLDGAIFPNTGGTQLFVSPFVSTVFSPYTSLRLAADLPVYTFMEGRQVATSFRLSASLYINLSRPKSLSL
ncbi:MAG: hypothetical protein AAFR61_25200, partial [Bacteroidota bacterium]